MSEYIYTTEGTFGLRECTGEEIVRCRDCKYLEANKYGYEIAEDDCGCIYWDADFSLGVAPDGFCAWGERVSE